MAKTKEGQKKEEGIRREGKRSYQNRSQKIGQDICLGDQYPILNLLDNPLTICY